MPKMHKFFWPSLYQDFARNKYLWSAGCVLSRPVVPGCAGCAMAHPDICRSVNPISTKGTDYAHLITTGTPGFSDLPTALLSVISHLHSLDSNQCCRFKSLSYYRHLTTSPSFGRPDSWGVAFRRRQLSALRMMEMPLDGDKYDWLLYLQTLTQTENQSQFKM